MNRDMEGKLSFAQRRAEDASVDIMRSHRREITDLLANYGLDVACLNG